LKKKNKYSLSIALLISILCASCQFIKPSEEEDKGEVIARVYDRYLYESDLNPVLEQKGNLSSRDSLSLVQNFINIWAKDQLMLYKAEFNLNENQKNFDEQITKYKNDLLKFTYQEEYLQQNLDTNISTQEIEEYYLSSRENFLLKENILIANYIIISTNAPKLSDARDWFKSKEKEDRENLRDFAIKYSREFFLEDSSWLSFDRLASKIPFEKGINQSELLSNNNFLEISDTNKIYLLEIVNYKLKNSHAPLSYIKNIIRNILINKKKLKLLADLEKNLLSDALEKKEFETYK
tara:strand:- start:1719 stop:2600 length:882 start_codon:yes stop_codon:yes gene_type:complete